MYIVYKYMYIYIRITASEKNLSYLQVFLTPSYNINNTIDIVWLRNLFLENTIETTIPLPLMTQKKSEEYCNTLWRCVNNLQIVD